MVLLSYPRIWSTVCMKPGDPTVVAEWLARSQKAPLTVIAHLNDTYEHPLCIYQDAAIATLGGNCYHGVCLRHKAVLSLDQLLPHRSRIRDLRILFRLSDPHWDTNDLQGEPTLLHHQFFRKSLPNLQRLDFRASHLEEVLYVIPIPDSLFAKEVPRLKELIYLGVTGGLTGTVKNLISCEIGFWSECGGPTAITQDGFRALLNNNKSLKSLTINDCELVPYGHPVATAIPMPDLKFLKIDSPNGNELERILNCIHAPQFENLDTVHLSLPFYDVEAVATDSSGHTFGFTQCFGNGLNFYPLRHFGVIITTLRLDQSIRIFDQPTSYEFLQSLDAVQVLEFDETLASYVQNTLSITGIFPRLKVIRVVLCLLDCEEALRLLAIALKRRMMEGNPLTTVEPLLGDDELGRGRRVEWDKFYKAEGIQYFLSK